MKKENLVYSSGQWQKKCKSCEEWKVIDKFHNTKAVLKVLNENDKFEDKTYRYKRSVCVDCRNKKMRESRRNRK
jgi:predicted ATP-dependent serine protease